MTNSRTATNLALAALAGNHSQDDSIDWSALLDFVPTASPATSTANGKVLAGAIPPALAASTPPAPPHPGLTGTFTYLIVDGGNDIIDGASAQNVTFTGPTGKLTLNDAPEFTGAVSGLFAADAIDLTDIGFTAKTTATYAGTATGGVLTVTDGTTTAKIAITGNYLSSDWTLSKDSGAGVTVSEIPTDWKTIHIGGGGAITGLDIAPNGVTIARTATNGAYLWNAATASWMQLVTTASLPAAYDFSAAATGNGGVYEIQAASGGSKIMYMQYQGAIFKSIDQGASWTFQTALVAPGADNAGDAYAPGGQKMAIDPVNPNIVLAGTETAGLFMTTNGGTTWTNISGVPSGKNTGPGTGAGITGILFNPVSATAAGTTKIIFAASYGNGVYETIDGGATWTLLTGGPTTVEYAAMSSNGVYYAIGNDLAGNPNAAVWKFNAGRWTVLLDVGTTATLQAIAVNPANPGEIVVASAGGYINVSYTAGATWSGQYATILESTDVPWQAAGNTNPNGGHATAKLNVNGMAFNPLIANQIILTGGAGVWNATVPAPSDSNSTNVTFTDQTAGIENLTARQILATPNGNNYNTLSSVNPIFASNGKPLFTIPYSQLISGAYPATYGPINSAVALNASSVNYASSVPTFLVEISDTWGVEESGYSSNSGKTWQPFVNGIPGAGTKYIGGTIAASTPTDIIWAPAGGTAPYYTLDGGTTWTQISIAGITDWSGFDPSASLNQMSITADRQAAATFYLYYAGYGVFKTTDGGAHWINADPLKKTTYIDPVAAYEGANSQLQAEPSSNSQNPTGRLFYTGGPQGTPGSSNPAPEPFYRSTDGGATWTTVSNVSDVTCFGFGAPVEPTAANPTPYAAIYIVGYVNNIYGVWQSTDDAASWTKIGLFPASQLDQITTISGDPNALGQVYVGFAGGGFAELAGTPEFTSAAYYQNSETLIPPGTIENAGDKITILLTANEPLFVTGMPTLTLNDGATASYTGGSGSNILTFIYTVATGEITPSLQIKSINTPKGTAITDGASNPVNPTPPNDLGPHIAALYVAPPVITTATFNGFYVSWIGTAPPNSTIGVYQGASLTPFGTTTADAKGAWTYSPAGVQTTKVTAKASDGDGDISAASAPVAAIVSSQAYTVHYAANGQPTTAQYASGVTENWIFKADNAYKTVSTGITGQPYTIAGNYYTASDVLIATVEHLKTGAGNLILTSNGLTVTGFTGSGGTLGSNIDTYAFGLDTSETVTLTGYNFETFDLAAIIGSVSIIGFQAAGTGHDVLQFHASSFGASLTAAHQSADLAALLSHTTQVGADCVIKDVNQHDSLTLVGVSKATLSLAANASDFKFI